MEAELVLASKILLTVVLGGFIGVLLHLYNVFLLKPEKLRSELRRQGIKGPSPSPILGNIPQMNKIQLQNQSVANHGENINLSHDWASTLFPYFDQWRIEYGNLFALESSSYPFSIHCLAFLNRCVAAHHFIIFWFTIYGDKKKNQKHFIISSYSNITE